LLASKLTRSLSWPWTLESGTATQPCRAAREDTDPGPQHSRGGTSSRASRQAGGQLDLTLFSLLASSFPAGLGSYVTCLRLMRLSCGHSKLAASQVRKITP
ncbi:hypothetical protein BAE44_0009275, partial [Dichanthelium oligosanthes]